MKFDSMVKLEATAMETLQGTKLKVYNPENSTQEYNMHPVVRVNQIGGNLVYVLAEKPDSSEGVIDEYLTYVLAYYNGQYITWLCNHSAGGFHHGHYFDGNFEAACKDFMFRGWEHLLPKGNETKEWKELRMLVDEEQTFAQQCYDKTSDIETRGETSAYTKVMDKIKEIEGATK